MSFFRRKKPEEKERDAQSKDYYEQALDWESSRIAMIAASERKAWKVAYVALIVVGLSWVTIVLMMPLKQIRPYLVRVDNATGATDILTTLADHRVTYDNIMDKYWIANFVRARETYDWWTLQSDYRNVGLLAVRDVNKEYQAIYEGENALHKVYGKNYRIRVDVLSIVPTGKGTATVRLMKTLTTVDAQNTGNENTKNAKKYVATLTYEYRNPSKMVENLRLVNPLGFQVLSYRLDPELVESPSLASPPAPAPEAAQVIPLAGGGEQ